MVSSLELQLESHGKKGCGLPARRAQRRAEVRPQGILAKDDERDVLPRQAPDEVDFLAGGDRPTGPDAEGPEWVERSGEEIDHLCIGQDQNGRFGWANCLDAIQGSQKGPRFEASHSEGAAITVHSKVPGVVFRDVGCSARRDPDKEGKGRRVFPLHAVGEEPSKGGSDQKNDQGSGEYPGVVGASVG